MSGDEKKKFLLIRQFFLICNESGTRTKNKAEMRHRYAWFVLGFVTGERGHIK